MKNMKRITGLVLAAGCLLTAGTAAAAPVNQMTGSETAIGASNKGAYIEHKITSKATLGYEYMRREDSGNQDQAYLQYDLIGSEFKAIAGYRWNMPHEDKAGTHGNVFAGAAVSTPKVFGFDAYASYVAGKEFNESQFGINKNLALNIDLNLNYHNYKHDHGTHQDGVGVGLTVKF